MNPKTSYFNDLAPRWDDIVGNRDSERLQSLKKVFASIALKRDEKIIDAGCGNGVLFPFIEEAIGPKGEISAVDPAAEMIETARSNFIRFSNITYHATSLEEMPFPEGHYDTALLFAVFPHVDDKSKALVNLRRALKTGGRLVIFHLADTKTLNDFHATLDAPVRHDLLPYREEMILLLEGAGFRMEVYEDEPGLNYIESRAC